MNTLGANPMPDPQAHDFGGLRNADCEYANLLTRIVAVTIANDTALLSRLAGQELTARIVEDAYRDLLVPGSPSPIAPSPIAPSPVRIRGSDHGGGLVNWQEVLEEIVDLVPERPASDKPVAAEVLDVLRRSHLDDQCRLVLPRQQLSRALYAAVDDALARLGAQWDKRSKTHVFSDPLERANAATSLAALLATGTMPARNPFEFFETPDSLCEEAVDMAEVQPGDLALEPSAGQGALLEAMRKRGARVDAIEIDPRHVARLRDAGAAVRQGNFLAHTPTPVYDVIVMNPPFSAGQDLQHVTHALSFLKPTGRLVAITAPGFEFNQRRAFQAFRKLLDLAQADVREVPAGAFKSSGTNVSARMLRIDMPRLLERLVLAQSAGVNAGTFGLPADFVSAAQGIGEAESDTAVAIERPRIPA